MATVSETFTNGFHKHLDECKQCRENPMQLCQAGAVLLHCSVDKSFDQPKGSHPFDVFEQGQPLR